MTYAKHFINGEWKDGSSDKTIENVNPFSGELLFKIRSADPHDLDEAYSAAKNTQKKWEQTLPGERRAVLEKVAQGLSDRKEEIISWLIKEAGSTAIKAEAEWAAALNIVKEAASFPFRMEGKILPSAIPGKENRVYRTPKGVVGVIGPWNFPLHLAMRSVAPAIATGNTVVLKPSSDAMVTSGFLIADLFEKAELPKGVLNVVAGRGSEIGDEFVLHSVPKVISFTGSTDVGKHIAGLAAKGLKETALELGGNNVMVVLEDADLEQAANAAIFGKFLHQGQICMALNRIIVVDEIYDAFAEKFVEKAKKIIAGDPGEAETAVGPLINEKALERIQKDVEDSLEMGAKLLVSGKASGNVLHPIVLGEVTNDMPIAQKEIFGPVAPLIRAKDEADAIAIANDSEYGLSGSVFSGDVQRGVRAAKEIETGMIHINDQSVNDEAHVAFGGEKHSGIGRFGGEWAIEKFTTVKWIGVMEEPRKYPF
ncbi:aldehyde dehydrogenase family protein [Metabacillus sp. KIGAM252]|uniref:Aldehyde dehydrogenase family protein n=2 Tax=Metabacillus flavus TaxID=2823519 RepID=A0ABS5LAI2_9BACI|nr:aldehyde dehydrogenase family protein [Metabacillus flavus]